MNLLVVGPPRPFLGYDADQAALFAAAWLPAWTGNHPERLVSFYTEDTFYSDPEVPAGLHGRKSLLVYLRRLLARHPDWAWTQRTSAPMQDGFVNFWQAIAPIAGTNVGFSGVCLVVLRDGLIARNEVFFDRTLFLEAMRQARR